MDALKKALSLYSSRLGLDFQQGPGANVGERSSIVALKANTGILYDDHHLNNLSLAEELQLIFTQIDPVVPSRPFILGVKVHDDKSYEGKK